jgi:hypothetical protein
MRNRDSVVGVVIRLRPGGSGVHNRAGECFISSPNISRPALEPKQPPIQGVLGAPSPRVRWPGTEDDHSPPPSAAVRNERNYISTPTRLHGAYGDDFTFTFSLSKY